MIRQQIDKVVDWRRTNRPNDESEIRISVSPSELHRALTLPRPPRGSDYPKSILYRGFRVRATA